MSAGLPGALRAVGSRRAERKGLMRAGTVTGWLLLAAASACGEENALPPSDRSRQRKERRT